MDSKNNTGNFNTSKYNTGHCNTGDLNSGNCNSGNYNTSNFNTSNRNTGNFNTGNRNTGHDNTGNFNTGDFNTGNRNTGDLNSGNCNSGNYNTGHYNTGFFCMETPSPMFFDQRTSMSWDEAYKAVPHIEISPTTQWIELENMTEQEKIDNPTYATTGGYLRVDKRPLTEKFPEAWAKLTEQERKKWKQLPNFDAAKFKQITGVDVRGPHYKAGPVSEWDFMPYTIIESCGGTYHSAYATEAARNEALATLNGRENAQ